MSILIRGPEEHGFRRVTELAHALLRDRIEVGETVVDATVGTGADTVFLAECVGDGGRVIGFDVQADAIERARARLVEAEVGVAVELHLAGHERLAEFVEVPIAAAMFNLGYLPGGDKALITKPETTLKGLDAALVRLRSGGVVTVVCYPGHDGGGEEAQAVATWAEALSQEIFTAVRYGFVNQRNAPPFLTAIERR